MPWWYALLEHCQIDFSELIAAYRARLPERDVPEHYGWVAGESLFGFEVMTTASRDV